MPQLKRSEEKFYLLFENAPIGMAMACHETGDFLEVNAALLNCLGYSKIEFMQLSYWDITPETYYEQQRAMIELLDRTGKFGPVEKECICKDGSLVPIRLSGFKMIDVDERVVVWAVIEDITIERALKQEHLKVKQLSVTDHLTGLYNRQKLDEVLQDEINRTERSSSTFSVIMLDLDFFKAVNDQYGHYIGDCVLVELAHLIKDSSRKTDVVGRWGGEEFLIICPETDGKGAMQLAEHIRQTVEAHSFPEVGQKTASFGVVECYPADDAKSMIERVDGAMYDAKKQGRNQVVFRK